MNEFKAGDKVICVGHSDQWSGKYKIGKEYEIRLIPKDPEYITVIVGDKPGDWWDVLKCDFELVADSNEMPELKGGMYVKCGDDHYVVITPRHSDDNSTVDGLMKIEELAEYNRNATLSYTGSVDIELITDIFSGNNSFIPLCDIQFESTLLWKKEPPQDKLIKDLEDKLDEITKQGEEIQTKINELKELR